VATALGHPVGGMQLLEREGERARLSSALDRAHDGEGTVVLIAGHAGLGKSSLLEGVKLEAVERGLEVAATVANPLERDFAFGVALGLLEPLVTRGAGSVADRSGPASLAAPLFEGRALAPAGDIFPFIRGLHWLAVELADAAPLLLVVDDVQWADRPSLRWLVHLAQRIGDAPVALVAAVRSGEPDTPVELIRELERCAAPRLDLSPLSESAAGTLVRGRLPSVQADLEEACFEASRGNPFLLTQLVAEIDARGIDSAREVSGLVTEGILTAVAARLERLPPEARGLARIAALLADATLDEAATLAGLELDAAARAADALAAASLMAPGTPLRFVHPLVRSAVESTIAPGERGLRHLEAARLLFDRAADPERVAGHVVVGHRTASAWAVERLRAAARSARAAGAPRSAVAYLRRALEEPPPPHERTETLRELAQAEAATGCDEAACHLEEAIALTDPGPARAALLGELGHVLYSRGRTAEAAGAFDRGLADLGPGDEKLRNQLEAGWVTVARLEQGLRSEAVRRMQPLLDRSDFGATHAERVLLANVANQVLFAGEPRERSMALAERALAGGALLEEETAAGMTWCIAAGVLGWADDIAGMAAITDAAVADARRHGSVFGFAQAVYARSYASYHKGQLESALADLELAIDARRHGWEQFLPAAIAQYAWALVDRGELDAAARAITPAIREGSASPGPMLALLLEARARVALAQGDPRAALADALEAGRLLNDSLMPNPALTPWRGTAAIAASLLGDRDQAVELAAEAVGLATRFGAPRVVGMALRAAGVANGGAVGLELLREAVEVLEGSPSRLELARALVDLGAALRRERQAIAAREPLRRGLGLAVEFGALAIERRARDELAASGARPRRGSTRRSDGLTPSELRIAESAAQGVSNREIAQQLFLTIRTVETHLTHAYRKLGIASRAQLSDALARASSG
jgi:DNA-binding CsgD family transcriptional regulator